MELVCPHCGHIWNYKGKAIHYACCPDCHGSVKIDGQG
jgi:hypothetical protein